MDTQLNTVKIHSGAMYAITGKMATYIPEAGKKNGCKLTWPQWTQRYLPLLGAALVKLAVMTMVTMEMMGTTEMMAMAMMAMAMMATAMMATVMMATATTKQWTL